MPNSEMTRQRSMSLSPERGLFVGRFQPFHNGHSHAIQFILNQVEELIIGIASTEDNFTLHTPFTTAERIEMIWASLFPDIRQRCLIIPIPDQENNRMWADFILQYTPRFDIAFTNHSLQTILMEAIGVPVKSIPLLDRERLRGGIVRSLIANGDSSWESLLPTPTSELLKRIGAAKRLHALATARY